MAGVPFLDPPPAIVHGPAAVGMAFVLRRAMHAGFFDGLPEHLVSQTIAAVRAVDFAAKAWERRQPDRTAEPIAASGNSETRIEWDRAHSEDAMSVSEAAMILELGERQVRNLAASGLGRRVGKGWVLDRAAVEAERERRAG